MAELFEERLLQSEVSRFLREESELSPEELVVALELCLGYRDPSHTSLNRAAWKLVDPEEAGTQAPELPLAWARTAVELEPGKARYRRTLAYALSGAGMHDEAIEQLQRALDLEENSLRQRSLREDLERLRALRDEAGDGH